MFFPKLTLMKLKENTSSKNTNKSICILLTDHNSINEAIFIKSLKKIKKNKFKKIYIVGDKLKFKKIYNSIKNLKKIIYINCSIKNKDLKRYLKEITQISFKLYKQDKIKILINLPLNKKKYLYKKYNGYTEFFSKEFDNKNNENMLLYNENFSVCPLTTHIELSKVEKIITFQKILNCVINIENFFTNALKKKKQIVILGFNPHASQDFVKKNLDNTVIKNAINNIKRKYKKINLIGPVSADTAFLNAKNKVFIGMYHDQVLIPFKIINKFKGINITIGKRLLRLSMDHGTGLNVINKNKKIKNQSFLYALSFCEKFLYA